MNFAISAMGRSGTLSLAKLLNRNKNNVKVIHEPFNEKFYSCHESHKVSKRFVDNYGEVNSFLRNILFDLEVDKKAIIIRHPHKILLSSVNWKPDHLKNMEKFLSHLNSALIVLDRDIQRNIPYIKFEHMVDNKRNCLSNLISYLNLTCDASLPITHKTKKKIKSVEEIKGDISVLNWFVSRYYEKSNDCYFCT